MEDIEFQVQASENATFTLKADPNDLGNFVQSVAKNLWAVTKFSDIVLNVNGVSYPCHKSLLSSMSPLFLSEFEQNKGKNSINFQLDRNESELFIMMLQFIYKGSLEAITFDQVVPLLSLAHKYGVKPLKEQCGLILAQNVSADNAFQFLKVAKDFGGVETLQTACAHYISQNFKELLNDRTQILLKLDTYTFKKMLESNDLNVRSEREVFEAVVRYATQFDGKKQEEIFNELLPVIRYNLLPIKYLVETVENHRLLKDNPVLKKLIHETYRYKVVSSLKPSYITKHRKSTSLKYEFNTDKKGPSIKISFFFVYLFIYSLIIYISDDRRTATNGSSTYEVVHGTEFYDDGVHVFRVKVTNSTYVGIGVVDETLNSYTREFHNQPGCYVYYMSGPGYSNGTSDGNIEGFSHGDVVTLVLNMEEKSFKLVKRGRVIKTMVNIKGRKTLGVLLSNNGSATLLGEDDEADDNWQSAISE